MNVNKRNCNFKKNFKGFAVENLLGHPSLVFIGFIDLLLEPSQFLSTHKVTLYCFHFEAMTIQNKMKKLNSFTISGIFLRKWFKMLFRLKTERYIVNS